MTEIPPDLLEATAAAFHETYERLAPSFEWETQEQSRVAWDEVPEHNRRLMIATIEDLLNQGVIELGAAVVAPFRREET